MDGNSPLQPGQTIQPSGDSPAVPPPPKGPPNPPAPLNPTPEPPVPSAPEPPEPEPGEPAEAITPGQNLPPLLSWEASEYISHSHGALWYLGVLVATAALIASSLFIFKEWLSAVVVVLMMAALVVYARRAPRILKYVLNEAGLVIGPKFFPFTEFRSFALQPEHNFFTIELEPLRRFMPRLSIFLDQKDAEAVSDALEQHLPREDRKPDAIDRLTRRLKL